MTIEELTEKNDMSSFEATINGVKYSGYISPSYYRINKDDVPDGWYLYHARTGWGTEKLSTIENCVIVDYFGSVLLTVDLKLAAREQAKLEWYTIDGCTYNEYPEIYKYWGDDNKTSVTPEEMEYIKHWIGSLHYREYNDCGYHAFRFEVSYKMADSLVSELNEMFCSGDDDIQWWLGDRHECYVID